MKRISPFLLLCIMGGLAIFSSTMSKSPALPLFAGSLGIPDKYGRIQVIVNGLLLGGATTLFLGFTTNYILLMALIALFGLSLATVTASTGAFVADMSEASSRGSAMGMLSTIMDIGQSSGPIVTGVLVATYQFRFAFSSVGLFMMAASLIYAFVIRGVSKRAF